MKPTIILAATLLSLASCAIEDDNEPVPEEESEASSSLLQDTGSAGGASRTCHIQCGVDRDRCVDRCVGTKPGYSKCINACYDVQTSCDAGCRWIPF